MKYTDIWNSLKLTDSIVIFTVSKAVAPTVIQGLKRTKSSENVVRRKLGMRAWSKLVITQYEISATMLRVEVKFSYQAMKL